MTNDDGNIHIGFNFEELPSDFDKTEKRDEKWVPFVMRLIVPALDSRVAGDLTSFLNVFEIERIIVGLRNLFSFIGSDADGLFSHTNLEFSFRVRVEYLSVDDIFSVELWLMMGPLTNRIITGFDIGVRFMVENDELKRFADEVLKRLREVWPQCPF